MTGKKMLSIVIVAELLLVVFASMSTAASPKSTDRIIGGVYNPGEEWGSTAPGGEASYGNATFYTPNADQSGLSSTGGDAYDVQYYGYHIEDPYNYPTYKYAHHYGYHLGRWYAPQNLNLSSNVPGETEYIVIVETINGITKNAAGETWSGANFTGSTNMTATSQETDYMPDIYLEQIPTPQNKSTDPATGKIVINWTGLDEWIAENSVASSQKWKIQASNIVGYSVYRMKVGETEFKRVGNSTPQVRGGEVYFVDTVEPGDYYYRIAVNYRYPANDGTNIIDQNGNPESTKGLPGIFVSTGRSNISDVISTDIEGPVIENMQPVDGSVLITNTTTISANYSDPCGIDTSSVILLINEVNYTLKAVITETGVSYYYTNIPDGSYTVYLEVKDNSTNHNKAPPKTWFFKVDTTSPNVTVKAPTGDKVLVFAPINITFSEPMNTTISMADIFSIAPDPGGWHWDWYGNDTEVRGTHNNFTVNTTYNCSINTNAKDKPGNHLDKDYSWNFTTIANLSVTLNWPYVGTEDWTGGSEHTISYSVGGGLSPYTVYLNYTTNGATFIPINETKNVAGVYLYTWTLPNITNTTVQVRVEATDSLGAKLSDTSKYFIIDSTKPTVNQSWPLNGSYTPLGSDIVIVFDESMNTATVGASGGSLIGCSCTPDPSGWVATWSDGDKKLTLSHNDFTKDQLYTFTITTDAKDKSDPGNGLKGSYSWSFTAVPGKGVFTVNIACPTSAEIGKEYQVTVTVNNAGPPTAYNYSGTLTVKFYKIYVGEIPVLFDTKTINAMSPGGSDIKSSALFTFDKPGTWYIKVELSSTNSIDVIQGYTQSYDTSIPIIVTSPPEEIGIGPYILIVVMVVLVVIVGVLTLWTMKKKRKLTLWEMKKKRKF